PSLDGAPHEAKQPGLGVGPLRWLDLRAHAAGPAHGLVDGLEELEGGVHSTRVEALVLARGPGEVPRVHQGVGAQQPVHQALEGLLAEHAADHRRRPLLVGQGVLHGGRGRRPRVLHVLRAHRGGLASVQRAHHPAMGVDHVPGDVDGGPFRARRRGGPAIRWAIRQPGGETLGHTSVTGQDVVFAVGHGSSVERDDAAMAEPRRRQVRPALLALGRRTRQVLLLAAITGVLTGAGVAAFEWVAREQLFHWMRERSQPVQIAAPTVGLMLAALCLRYLSGRASPATADEYIRSFHDPVNRLDLRPVAGRLLASVATLGLGGAMGYEGPSIYLG